MLHKEPNDTITSLTLPAETVREILTNHLNVHVLRRLHTVIDVDCVEETGMITLTLKPETADPEPETFTALPAFLTACSTGANPNGHNSDGAIGGSPAQEATPAVQTAEASKRRTRIPAVTPELHAEILRLAGEGRSASYIARTLRIGVSTVSGHVAHPEKFAASAAFQPAEGAE